ncbi:MAG: hypothetical protein Q7R33_04375 [Nitrosarchaeum sp.]|nr:hypothetical protein [Nitrosarchaeum sp.]
MLQELGLKYNTDKAQHGYLPIYESYLGPIRHEVTSILELGILRGQSLLMWQEFFPNAKIYGLDIDPDTNKDYGLNIKTFTGSQDNCDVLQSVIDTNNGPLDVIIDDASHITNLTIASFNFLIPFTKRFYIFEDMRNTYDQPLKSHLENDPLGWPGQHLNTLKDADWFNYRADVNAFLQKIIRQIDFNINNPYDSIHIHNMTYILKKKYEI